LLLSPFNSALIQINIRRIRIRQSRRSVPMASNPTSLLISFLPKTEDWGFKD
jgi:hypothetical protein